MYTEAPDGGWGWVVGVAFFLVEMFTYGSIKSFGIFLQDLMEEFGESNSRVSWIVSIAVFVMTFNGEPGSHQQQSSYSIHYTTVYSLRLRSSVICLNQPFWVPTCCHDWRIAHFFRRYCHHLYHLCQPNICHLWITYRYSVTNIHITLPLSVILIFLYSYSCFPTLA